MACSEGQKACASRSWVTEAQYGKCVNLGFQMDRKKVSLQARSPSEEQYCVEVSGQQPHLFDCHRGPEFGPCSRQCPSEGEVVAAFTERTGATCSPSEATQRESLHLSFSTPICTDSSQGDPTQSNGYELARKSTEASV